MVCARCGASVQYGQHIRSRYTDKVYCRNYTTCTERVLALLDGKEVVQSDNERALTR